QIVTGRADDGEGRSCEVHRGVDRLDARVECAAPSLGFVDGGRSVGAQCLQRLCRRPRDLRGDVRDLGGRRSRGAGVHASLLSKGSPPGTWNVGMTSIRPPFARRGAATAMSVAETMHAVVNGS